MLTEPRELHTQILKLMNEIAQAERDVAQIQELGGAAMNRPLTYLKGWNSEGQLVDYTNKCTGCGYPMPLPEWGSKFCPNCGRQCVGISIMPVVATRECFRCGETVPKEVKFCPHCGVGLTSKVNAIFRGEKQ